MNKGTRLFLAGKKIQQPMGETEGFYSALRKIWGLMDIPQLLYSEEVDEFGLDESIIERVRPAFDFLYERFWRVETYCPKT